jgi:hypothetical protein
MRSDGFPENRCIADLRDEHTQAPDRGFSFDAVYRQFRVGAGLTLLALKVNQMWQ